MHVVKSMCLRTLLLTSRKFYICKNACMVFTIVIPHFTVFATIYGTVTNKNGQRAHLRFLVI